MPGRFKQKRKRRPRADWIIRHLPEPGVVMNIFLYLNLRDVYGDIFYVYWNHCTRDGVFMNLSKCIYTYGEALRRYRKELKNIFFSNIPVYTHEVFLDPDSSHVISSGVMASSIRAVEEIQTFNRRRRVCFWNNNFRTYTDAGRDCKPYYLDIIGHFVYAAACINIGV